MAERVLGNVISSGVKVLVLAVIVGIGSTLFSQFTAGFGGNQPTIEDAMSMVLAALSIGPWYLRARHRQWHCLRRPATRRGCSDRNEPGCWWRCCRGRSRRRARCGSRRWSACRRRPKRCVNCHRCFKCCESARRAAGEAAMNAGEAGQGAASSHSPSVSEPPTWATRMKRSQNMSHGASAATHAVRSGDHGGGGAAVDLSEGKS